MKRINIEKVVKIIKGKVLQKGKRKTLGHLSIDTRKLRQGDLFIALKGENFDGHKFLGEAIKKGASGIILSKIPSEFNFTVKKRKNHSDFLIVKVSDTLYALQELAKYYRKMFDCSIIGITGSNGKTTTKEMITSILKYTFPVLATEGNLNNQIGLPLTLLRLETKYRVGILEMGASSRGEIARLAQISAPQIGLVTNISKAHLEFFGCIRDVVSGKMELIDALPKRGVAILNSDDVWLKRILNTDRIKCKLITYGIKNRGHVYATHIKISSRGMEFRLHIGSKEERVRLSILGIFNVYNALAASAIGLSLNIDLSLIKQGLERFSPLPMHMERMYFKGIEIINDAYNANPVSMKNAIITFSKSSSLGRKILVLGDMLELGKVAIGEHRKIGRIAARSSDILFTFGDLSTFIAHEAEKSGMNATNIFIFKDKKKLASELKKIVKNKDSILLKASRAMRLEEVVEKLTNSK